MCDFGKIITYFCSYQNFSIDKTFIWNYSLLYFSLNYFSLNYGIGFVKLKLRIRYILNYILDSRISLLEKFEKPIPVNVLGYFK